MTVVFSDSAKYDIADAVEFYEEQEFGSGSYFLETVLSDIDKLQTLAGVHRKYRHKHRMICSHHPFAVFNELDGDTVNVKAVLDCRRKPSWLAKKLRRR